MVVTLSDEMIQLLGWERYQSLRNGTAYLSIGVHEILYIDDNKSKIDVIKDGTIKSVV